MPNDATRATARDLPDPIFEVRNKLVRIRDLNELVFMAGEGLHATSKSACNAICAGCDTINDLLKEVCDLIDGRAA